MCRATIKTYHLTRESVSSYLIDMKKALILLLVVLTFGTAKAQKVGIKTNLLYDVTANANLGLEFAMAPKWTFDLSGDLNAWKVRDMKWKHWLVQPEFRYWFCDRFGGHFLGFHAIGGQYNVGHIRHFFKTFEDKRYQGWGIGAGIAYGYAWMLGKHWNLEAEIGVGYIFLDYTKYNCESCSRRLGDGHYNYVGPTKLALNLEYLF